MLVLLATPAILSAQAASQEPDEALLSAGQAAAQAGDLKRAEALLEMLRKRHPHNFDVNEYLGMLYASDHQFELALPRMQAAVAEEPSSETAHANLGIAYLQAGRAEQAKAQLEQSVQLDPSQAGAQEALGQALLLLVQPAKAAAAFAVALQSRSDKPDLIYNAALACFESGDAARAATLLAGMPGISASAAAQSLYGDVEERLGNYADATQHDLNAVHLDKSEGNYEQLGVELLRHWTFSAALQTFEEGLQRYPASERLRFGAGVASYADQNYAKAIETFTTLLAAHSADARYADMLGRSCGAEAAGAPVECDPIVALAQSHPADAVLATDAATMLMHRPASSAQAAQVAALLQLALTADPAMPEARLEEGIFLQSQSAWERSIPQLQEAVRLQPEYAAAHYRLGLAYAHTGQHTKAQQEVSLSRQYAESERERLDRELKQVTTIVLKTR